ncbi:hypothetical protein [uncultured Olleya sp.]|uniref:hypothetical protein n=1 Tax=uncultured Olleya sp. TaxID=757243 RepID=UPI00259453C3|nr:hypothetical protein [uncultured Olleya sp.]
MSDTIIAAILGAGVSLLAMFFRIRSIKKALNIANQSVINDIKIQNTKLLDNKNIAIDNLTIETEKLKNKWKLIEIERDRLQTEKIYAVFSSIDDSNNRKESLIALKDFNAFIFDLNQTMPFRTYYEDESEYTNDIVESMESKLKDSIKFTEEFLKSYSHIYESKGIISELNGLFNKCKLLATNSNLNYHDHLNNLIVNGPEFGEVWDKFHEIFKILQKENDTIIMLQKEYLIKLKSTK